MSHYRGLGGALEIVCDTRMTTALMRRQAEGGTQSTTQPRGGRRWAPSKPEAEESEVTRGFGKVWQYFISHMEQAQAVTGLASSAAPTLELRARNTDRDGNARSCSPSSPLPTSATAMPFTSSEDHEDFKRARWTQEEFRAKQSRSAARGPKSSIVSKMGTPRRIGMMPPSLTRGFTWYLPLRTALRLRTRLETFVASRKTDFGRKHRLRLGGEAALLGTAWSRNSDPAS